MNELLSIGGDDLWVKVVEMLQQNWATIEPVDAGGVRVYFVSDTGGVFDEMAFGSEAEAIEGLTRNGFERFVDAPDLKSFLRPPEPPFRVGRHPFRPRKASGLTARGNLDAAADRAAAWMASK